MNRQLLQLLESHPIDSGRDLRPDSKYSTDQLKKGIKIEYEHTKFQKKSKMIAKDHLDEFPDYYTRLIKMEKQAKKERKR